MAADGQNRSNERHNQAAKHRRSIVSTLSNRYDTLAARALRWALPWTLRGYPGFHRGVMEIIGQRLTFGAVQHWRAGRRRLPVETAERLLDHISARVAIGQGLIDELTRYIAVRRAEPKRLDGCCVVRDRDGVIRDGRGRGISR